MWTTKVLMDSLESAIWLIFIFPYNDHLVVILPNYASQFEYTVDIVTNLAISNCSTVLPVPGNWNQAVQKQRY